MNIKQLEQSLLNMESYSISDLGKMNVRINLKRLIDQNNILKKQIDITALNQIHFGLDLFANNRFETLRQYSRIFIPKLLFDEPIIFNWFYQDLSFDTKIGISIWSSAKKYDKEKPLGSTVLSIFDDNGNLRQGKYHLFIWPDVKPDFTDLATTPGLSNDPNIQTLNFISTKLDQCQNSSKNNKKAEQALKFKLSYTYRLIPAAFLEVQFPKFSCPIMFSDKISEVLVNNYLQQYIDQIQIIGGLPQINRSLEINDFDFDTNQPNPLEQTFYFLARQNETNPQKMIPNPQEIKNIQSIIKRSLKIQLKPFQKQLFVKYRYYLTHDKKYLCYYLHSIQWNAVENNKLENLLKKWEKIQMEDALYLLSKDFSVNMTYNKKNIPTNTMKIIRDYAVTVLQDLPDSNILPILLHLVQSLKYDGLGQSNLFYFLNSRAQKNNQIAVLLHWYLKTESEDAGLTVKELKAIRDLASENKQIYQGFYNQMNQNLKQRKPQTCKIIDCQTKFLNFLRNVSKVVKQIKDMNNKKQQMRKRLGEANWQEYEGGISFPMDVNVILKNPLVSECTIFSSKQAPFKLTFETIEGGKFSFIYKNGDDLRQDQLILQMFALMDKLLKGVNQNYKLTPYKALACSRLDGYVQFISETSTFQEVMKNMGLKEYLGKSCQSQNNAEEDIMNNYLFSCAGYCAITYFFLIGDRHLENLLIHRSGRMFHIDFGFILGHDPKPYPPPIKIRKQMVQAMGGTEHQNFKIFKFKCLQAYLYLRKYAKLVYNLFYMMLDSGIPDVKLQGLTKLYDKFNVSMNDKQAQKYFLMVLDECRNAVFAVINDQFHKWADHFR